MHFLFINISVSLVEKQSCRDIYDNLMYYRYVMTLEQNFWLEAWPWRPLHRTMIWLLQIETLTRQKFLQKRDVPPGKQCYHSGNSGTYLQGNDPSIVKLKIPFYINFVETFWKYFGGKILTLMELEILTHPKNTFIYRKITENVKNLIKDKIMQVAYDNFF